MIWRVVKVNHGTQSQTTLCTCDELLKAELIRIAVQPTLLGRDADIMVVEGREKK